MLTFSGYYTYVSPSHRQLAYEPGEIISKFSLDFIHPDDRKKLLPILLKFAQMDSGDLARLKSENYTQRLEFKVTDSQGNWHDFEATGNIIESADGQGFNILLIERDVTERKSAENQLKQLYASERQARRVVEQEVNKRADFFRALVHELKTPLTPILVSSETLAELIEDQTFKNLARNVYNGATRLNTRVDELLDISREELGMLKVKCEPVNMGVLLKDIISYVQPQVSKSHQILMADIPASLPLINGDESRLRQVMLNLLNNAMRFTPEGGIIRIKASISAESILVQVQDTGCGIDESGRQRLFQPYNRIEEDRQHFSGLGLGLALCKQLIDLHGGKIWVESQKGKGTSFFFSLAIIKQPADLKV